MPSVRYTRPLDDLTRLLPDIEELLAPLNQALRNINYGKMDHLPYYHAVAGYQFAMRADLEPQGDRRPPAIGRWQLEISREGSAYRIFLQGKTKGQSEIGDVVFLCGPAQDGANWEGDR
ncbi:MAG: hypothetical protein M0Z53_10070 [Thermaerobacter sp.]|nr:hypothetical protein [Thermaerobacter sp.]